ncbi:MAG: phosphoribosylamine--glycine ligase [Methanimicrococcus sp.]|nr:phosphoribosylamine--glycine ligase [Methanimicrococcus sp.]
MKILLIGSGGREHAIAAAIKRSPQQPLLYSVMSKKNPGIAVLCEETLIHNEMDAAAIADFAKKNGIQMTFIGPEAPLSAGVSDALWAADIPAVGPKKNCAKIETDKAWARQFLEKYNIDANPKYGVFTDYDSAAAFIDELKDVAVKPAGLTGGKGVKVMGDQLPDIRSAKEYTKEVLRSDSVVIEERFIGEEFTLQAFVDGKHLAFCPTVQDHKRAYEGDVGPNTGGMGAYTNAGSLLPFLTKEEYETAQNIMQQTVDAFQKETGEEYKGMLYGQFILTKNGPKLIEYNARFGDPEAMNVLSLLESDMVEIMNAVVSGTLDKITVSFSKKATVCKYAVPAGYPDSPEKDSEIVVNQVSKEIGPNADLIFYYSSVYEKEGKIYTTGSRSIGVVGLGTSIEEAEKISQQALETKVKGNIFYRKDIGTAELVQKRIDHMNDIRKRK